MAGESSCKALNTQPTPQALNIARFDFLDQNLVLPGSSSVEGAVVLRRRYVWFPVANQVCGNSSPEYRGWLLGTG